MKNINQLLIQNGTLVNEGEEFKGHLLIEDGLIKAILLPDDPLPECTNTLDAEGLHIMPGIIDTHVHFRDPGFEEKGDMLSESAAALAGGVTSIMEMPNTNPKTTSLEALNQKMERAATRCLTNYAFYLGATNNNLDEIIRIPPSRVCGVKMFMGSSTGDMLVDKQQQLESIFAECPVPIAVHCENEKLIRERTENIRSEFGENPPFSVHADIRDEAVCFSSTQYAVKLARKYGSRLHICHLSTEDELSLLEIDKPLSEKKITSEVSIHHLYFDTDDYDALGAKIKVNPAIKNAYNKKALLQALSMNHIDIIATDHAPHLLSEKEQSYFLSPSGMPMIQHSLIAMLELYHKGFLSLTHIVDKMCHSPATLFQIANRGFIREGYKADLALVHLNAPEHITKENIRYKCGWSALEGQSFHSRVDYTMVNGRLVYKRGDLSTSEFGQALVFNR